METSLLWFELRARLDELQRTECRWYYVWQEQNLWRKNRESEMFRRSHRCITCESHVVFVLRSRLQEDVPTWVARALRVRLAGCISLLELVARSDSYWLWFWSYLIWMRLSLGRLNYTIPLKSSIIDWIAMNSAPTTQWSYCDRSELGGPDSWIEEYHSEWRKCR